MHHISPGKYKTIWLASMCSIISKHTYFLLKVNLHCNLPHFRNVSSTSVVSVIIVELWIKVLSNSRFRSWVSPSAWRRGNWGGGWKLFKGPAWWGGGRVSSPFAHLPARVFSLQTPLVPRAASGYGVLSRDTCVCCKLLPLIQCTITLWKNTKNHKIFYL